MHAIYENFGSHFQREKMGSWGCFIAVIVSGPSWKPVSGVRSEMIDDRRVKSEASAFRPDLSLQNCLFAPGQKL